MKTLRRYNAPHADYFITGVTYQRRPILLTDPQLFFESWVLVDLDAWVHLEDHFHVIFNVGDFNVSHILHHFKITYSRRFRDLYGAGRVWQNRF